MHTLPCLRTAEHAWYMIRGPLMRFTHYSACASFFFTCCLSVSAAAFCMLMICCAGTLSSSGNPCCAQRAAAAPACANLYLPGIQSHTPHWRGNDISVITVSVMQGSNSYALQSHLCQEGVSFVHVSIKRWRLCLMWWVCLSVPAAFLCGLAHKQKIQTPAQSDRTGWNTRKKTICNLFE